MAIKSLNEIIKFNNRFKTSINLYLSLNKAEKVLSYIPTKSSVNFLDGYMQATINNKEQATLLVGPYGKGKSHLLLVLLAILSMERTGENTQIIEELADKISAVDELGEQAASDVKLLWSKNRFLPVIINDTTGDLNQAFLLALNDALKREKLVDLAPDTYYSIALNRIQDWQENYPETYRDFITELKSIGIEHKEFIYELKRYSRTALDTFISVYPKITSGSIFNPLAVSEVLPLYKSVSERLVEDYGFSGIYIVFDEFSKFIEGLTDGNVGNNMKLLQDVCELATDSYIRQMNELFSVNESINLTDNRIKNIVLCMQRWFRSLPQATRNLAEISDYPNQEVSVGLKVFKKILQKVEYNPYEIVFDTLPKELSAGSYQEAYAKIVNCKNSYDMYLSWVITLSVSKVYDTFDRKRKNDLYHVLKEWYEQQSKLSKQGLHSGRITNFMSCIEKLDVYDDAEVAKRVVKALSDIYIENWNDGALDEFSQALSAVKAEVETIHDEKNEGQRRLTFVGKNGKVIEKYYEAVDERTGAILRNILEDTLDEFDDLSVNDRVGILLEMIEKVIG